MISSLRRVSLCVCIALLGCGAAALPLAAQAHVLPGVCFGAFRDGESPTTHPSLPSNLAADLATVAHVSSTVRTYGMAGTGALVPELCDERGLRCWPGAWIGRDRAAADLECELLVRVAKRFPKTVDTVLVGNEVLLRGDLDESSLLRRIAKLRRGLRSSDSTETRVGTAEPWHVWLAHREFAQTLDVVVVHVHPYHDGVRIEDAADWTIEKLEAVQAAVDGVPVVLGEFGWPTAGDVHGAAAPSPENAARYFAEVLPRLRKREEPSFVFEMWDEAWKATVEGDAGAHWGMFTSDGAIKPGFAAAIPGIQHAVSTRAPRRHDDDLREPGRGNECVPRVVELLTPLVERETGIAFRNPPRVRVTDDFEWSEIVRRELPEAKDPGLAAAITMGLFLPDRGEVVLSPYVGNCLSRDPSIGQEAWEPRSLPGDVREAWLIAAHELVHVLDEQEFQIASRMRATEAPAEKLVLRSLLEGHAFSVQARLARDVFGCDDWDPRVLERRFREDRALAPGYRYMKWIRATGGSAAEFAALGEHPPTPKEFARGVVEATRAERAARRGK